MNSKQLVPPQGIVIEKRPKPLTTLIVTRDGTEHKDKTIRDYHCKDNERSAEYPVFHRVYLEHVNFDHTRWQRAQFKDVVFDRCALATADWEAAVFQRVELHECRLTGFAAADSFWQHVTIKGCRLQVAQLRFALFQTVVFENCDLREANFQGSDLSGVIFRNCDLSQAQLSHTKLVGTDLRGSKIDDLKIGLDEIRGAIVDPFQAVYLATLMGIVIKDQEDV